MRRFSTKKKAPSLPSTIELEVTGFSHDGRGLGRYQGRVVMASGALPGELCTVAIEQGNTNLWQGKVVAIRQPSQSRTAPKCPLYSRCGGCQLQHVAHDVQIEFKEDAIKSQLARQKIDIPPLDAAIVSEPYGYRHRARLHLSKKGLIGFYAQKGHDVIDVSHCPVLIPKLQQAMNVLREEAPVQRISQLELVVDDDGQVGLVVLGGEARATATLEQWAKEQGWCIKSPMRYQAGQMQVGTQPGGFTQVNRAINKKMIEQVADWLSLKPSDRLLDLFCGNGNMSLALSDSVSEILGLESSQQAVEYARHASKDLPKANFDVVDLFSSDLNSLASVLKYEPTAIILDPPRAGADRACKTLSKLTQARKLVYVSCDPATMARDLKYLMNDNWHLRKVGLIDMFPQTRHIETMALLEK